MSGEDDPLARAALLQSVCQMTTRPAVSDATAGLAHIVASPCKESSKQAGQEDVVVGKGRRWKMGPQVNRDLGWHVHNFAPVLFLSLKRLPPSYLSGASACELFAPSETEAEWIHFLPRIANKYPDAFSAQRSDTRLLHIPLRQEHRPRGNYLQP